MEGGSGGWVIRQSERPATANMGSGEAFISVPPAADAPSGLRAAMSRAKAANGNGRNPTAIFSFVPLPVIYTPDSEESFQLDVV